MSVRVYSEIFLHVTWHVDGDSSVLKGDVEAFVQNFVRNRCRQTKGVFFHGIGGTETHVHLAIQVEPFVLISDFVGEVKGAAAHEANKHLGGRRIVWQRGYGVVSFGKRNLEWVLDYVAKQRQHHASGAVFHRLEADGGGNPAEAGCQAEPGPMPPPEGGV